MNKWVRKHWERVFLAVQLNNVRFGSSVEPTAVCSRPHQYFHPTTVAYAFVHTALTSTYHSAKTSDRNRVGRCVCTPPRWTKMTRELSIFNLYHLEQGSEHVIELECCVCHRPSACYNSIYELVQTKKKKQAKTTPEGSLSPLNI